jgi:hypothetical protein
VYLGTSWTWCIGMFLPVLLMRELGFGGFAVFAVPNVLGAAAMGWVLRDAERSRALVENNRSACVWFSLVTILFHAFFAAWIIRRIVGPDAGIAVVAAFAFFWLILQWRGGGKFLAASLALTASLAALAWGLWRRDLPYIAHPVLGAALPRIDMLWLAPVCLFGFLCCPYLDLTFHAARQDLARGPARAAFAIGFSVVFLAMILFTVAYSGWLVVGFDRHGFPQLALLLSIHLITQCCLTVAYHAKRVGEVEPRMRLIRVAVFSILLVIAVLLGVVDRGEFTYDGMRLGEIVYRVFLGFYALAFPVYVWLRMVRPRRSMLRVGAVIVIASPLYWLGFIERQMVFAALGALIAFVSRFLPGAQATAE